MGGLYGGLHRGGAASRGSIAEPIVELLSPGKS